MRFPFEGDYLVQNTIWLNTPGKAIRAFVDDPNATVDKDGSKYIKAGTFVGGSGDFKLDADYNITLQPVTDVSQAQGILVNDVDISKGKNSAPVAIGGTINIHWMYDSVKAQYTGQTVAALRQSLPNLKIVDRY